jgi:integrase
MPCTATNGEPAWKLTPTQSWGSCQVADVDTALVMLVIQPMWNAKAVTASRIRNRIESVLDWATTSGYRKGDNPARWKAHIENLLPARTKIARIEHHAAMAPKDVADFLAEMRAKEGKAAAAKALEFLVYAASRTEEVVGATWPEFDLVARVWTIPGTRMKGGREHRVPLSRAAMEIVEGMRGRDPVLVFPDDNGKRLGKMRLLRVLERMGLRGAATVHGFRSTFRDWAGDYTNFPRELAEMALAHRTFQGDDGRIVGGQTEEAYRRGDMLEKRRKLMEAWAKFCATPVPGANVVPIKSRL